MKKLISLLRACMTEGMQLFKIGKGKKNDRKSGRLLFIIVVLLIGMSVWVYANAFLDSLVEVGAGFVMLTIFVLITALLTLVEGIYKSGTLLFNCKDDDLILSLPIRKSTVLFVRIFKLYIFEMFYNALFLVPAMLAYAMRVEVDGTFYLASVVAIVLLPVIPVVLACVVGGIVANFSAKFKMKNLAQIVVTVVALLVMIVLIGSLESIMMEIAANASSINELIARLYYPAGAYVGMITDFKVVDLLIFIIVNAAIFGVMVAVLGKVYYKINSRVKIVKTRTRKVEYRFKKNSIMGALVLKELRRFVNTPVLVINAGFGLVLFVVGCVALSINFESLAGMLKGYGVEGLADMGGMIGSFAPAILLGLICMASMMSSVTSSMISLEGKSFTLLKSIPVKPMTVLMGKVLAAVLVMVPFIVVGDIIMFIRFDFNLIEMILILLASVILPVVAELVGIALNLKYPKMNAANDAEVVKQSSSAMVATFLGMGVTILTAFVIMKVMELGVPMDVMLAGGVIIYMVAGIIMVGYVGKMGVKKFCKIEA